MPDGPVSVHGMSRSLLRRSGNGRTRNRRNVKYGGFCADIPDFFLLRFH